MSVIKPALKNEYQKPDLATQILIDAKYLLRDRLRMGGYKMSPGLKEALVAAFTSEYLLLMQSVSRRLIRTFTS